MKKNINTSSQLRNLCNDLLDISAMSSQNAVTAQEMLEKYKRQIVMTQAMLFLHGKTVCS
ncbi:MAG: hypothetical protein RIG62_14395 [Cyclobacteriaceae bacterium]